jgi:hypothetical protein
MTEKKNFWATLPGILTGTATVITAGLGLMTTLNSSGTTGNKQEKTTTTLASPSPTASGTLAPETLFDDFPRADLVPQSLDFSDLGVGRSETKSVTVINSGESDLVIDAVEVTGDGAPSFKVVQDTCASSSVAPGSRCEVTVAFSPPAVGSFLATLELQHNAQDTPSEVPLRGEGVLLEL